MTKLKLVLASALATTLATTAMANTCSFSGFYAGGQVGMGVSKSHVNTNTVPAAIDLKFGGTGVVGGLHVGYGKHFPNRFYMGLEAYGNLSNSKSNNNVTIAANTYGFKIKREHNFGIALRPGIVFGNTLVYAKLGVESGKFKYSNTFNNAVSSSSKKRVTAFVPGLGVAFHANEHVVLGLESTYSMHKKKNGVKHNVLDTVVRASYKW